MRHKIRINILWNSITNLKKFYRERWVIWIIGLIIFVITSYVIVIIYVFSFFKTIFLGKYNEEYNHLDRIQLEYQLDNITDLVWQPTIRNLSDSWYVENIFIKKWYILQLITDSESKIVWLWITCTDKKFNYKIGGIQLCKSKLSNIPDYYDDLRKMNWYIGPKHIEYYESYWWYWYLWYLFYLFWINDNWYLNIEDLNIDPMEFSDYTNTEHLKRNEIQDKRLIEFRKKAVINTYYVSLNFPEKFWFIFWPSWWQLRYFRSKELKK